MGPDTIRAKPARTRKWTGPIGGVTLTRSKHQGEANPRAKYTEAMIREIRRLRVEEDVRPVCLCQMFGISRAYMGSILAGVVWRHI